VLQIDRFLQHFISLLHVFRHLPESTACNGFNLVDLLEGLVQILARNAGVEVVHYFLNLRTQEFVEDVSLQVRLLKHERHVPFVHGLHFCLHVLEQALGFLFGELLLADHSIVDYIVVHAEHHIIEDQLLHLSARPRFDIFYVLVGIEHLEYLCLELGLLDLLLDVAFEHNHVAISRHKYIY